MTSVVHVLYLRGEDVSDRSYWAWEWGDDGDPQSAVLENSRLGPLLAELDAALPGVLADERGLTREVLLARLQDSDLPEQLQATGEEPVERLREILMVLRCMRGAFSQYEAEVDLTSRLGAALLPDRLVAALRSRAADVRPENVELRVMPPPSCVRVPWELLGTGQKGERLLDLARVVTMAPLLGRDGDLTQSHPDWERVKDEPELYVIDPMLSGRESEGVLLRGQEFDWEDYLAKSAPTATTAIRTTDVNREWLSQELRRPRSRFMYVGHVAATDSTAGKTALRLNDPAVMYGLGGRHGVHRDLTAQDLLAGTYGSTKVLLRLAAEMGRTPEDALREEFGGTPIYPNLVSRENGQVVESLGHEIWPMPPRVALIACHSGSDLGHAEPFGLVTAILENGAEVVTATRWMLLVDVVFRLWGIDGAPVYEMAVAVDDMQRSEDPFATLARWQRERLVAWREGRRLIDSPIIWASVANFHSPDRTLR